ncbi:MAG: efflux RND transporter permease subunit [Arenicellales bacterium]|nr:efflux RND transporter permease subunit [Arenicellales bacterium]
MNDARLGLAGRLAALFLHSQLTPLMMLAGILLGVFAVLVTPREEEPQINVTFADIFVPFPGASAAEVEKLVTIPAEQVLSEIPGVKHVYSQSRPGMAIVTVRFKVGEKRTDAIVRLYNKVFSHSDWFPQALGVGQPLVKPKGIDDVPIVTATLWSDDVTVGAYDLAQVGHALEVELKKVPGTRDIYTVGAPEQAVHVLLDAQKMAGYGIAVEDLRRSLIASNVSKDAGSIVDDNRQIAVKAGTFLTDADQIGRLVVGLNEDRPIYLADVASVHHGPYQPEQYVQHTEVSDQARQTFPAVTVAIAKKPGTNAVRIADSVITRLQQLQGIVIPDNVNVKITRNYGETADAKARKLIQKLAFATLSVVVLVLLTMGWREATIVGMAVFVTLAITLFASWVWGFTINRVSLFALIFSIGILVDDAIVIVENIHRRKQIDRGTLAEIIPVAVDEVGGPTILATFTVVAALLPMAFVSGLMGPYMSPIPINASTGMIISLLIALTMTPWLSNRLMKSEVETSHQKNNADSLTKFFNKLLSPFLNTAKAKRNRFLLGLAVLGAIALSLYLVIAQSVVLKMLPFDDKSEIQIVVDMREGSSLEQTNRVLDAIGAELAKVPEVESYQSYAGTPSPIGFNGLVRQYYLRTSAHLGEVQITLAPKTSRDRKSHTIARDIRQRLHPIGETFDASIKIVEVPPGPPVFAPLVAEIYGLDYAGQIAIATKVSGLFKQTEDIVDIDDSIEYPAPRWNIVVDRQRAAQLGVDQESVVRAVAVFTGGDDVSYLRDTHLKYAVPIRLELSVADKANLDNLLALKVRGGEGMVPLAEIVDIHRDTRDHAIYHKDLLPVVYVTGDAAGDTDSPLYGMFELYQAIDNSEDRLTQYLVDVPDTPYVYSLKWDGEWQVTYETFRDMGIAYAVGILLIYLLVVGQFKSYLAPLVIMAPIPLTIIGVLPGHALLGAKFTATSMIGMIALAGIIVRNSILLVDFINEQIEKGMPLAEAVILSGAVRAKPIILTGIAAMLGAFFILDDPIFNGLAVSLIFGIFVSTALTLMVIPIMYYAMVSRWRGGTAPSPR